MLILAYPRRRGSGQDSKGGRRSPRQPAATPIPDRRFLPVNPLHFTVGTGLPPLPQEIVGRILRWVRYVENEAVVSFDGNDSCGSRQYVLSKDEATRATQRELYECALVSRLWAFEALRQLWREVPLILHGLSCSLKSELPLKALCATTESEASGSPRSSYSLLSGTTPLDYESDENESPTLCSSSPASSPPGSPSAFQVHYSCLTRHVDVEVLFPAPEDFNCCTRLSGRLSQLSDAIGQMSALQSIKVSLSWVPKSQLVGDDAENDVEDELDVRQSAVTSEVMELPSEAVSTTAPDPPREVEPLPPLHVTNSRSVDFPTSNANPWTPLRIRVVRLFSTLLRHPSLRRCDVQVSYSQPSSVDEANAAAVQQPQPAPAAPANTTNQNIANQNIAVANDEDEHRRARRPSATWEEFLGNRIGLLRGRLIAAS
ncbi:hypothetical protein DFJ73DRAFT_11651 [Zopfochytrium polystomum]|nr:hypothetical protein DFJ73DRAFT_11651 [Zopfochytrium polystomum]